MLERIFARLGKAKLRCAVVTPIGPGHSQAYRECEGSVKTAWRSNHGPFTALDLLPIDDSAGKLGRSVARNEGVRKATARGAEWIFFLDADDLMLPEAFGQVSDLIDCYDAIWGLIHSRKFGAAEHHLRLPQILSISRIESLFVFDPFLTLQMGHFVRTTAALATPFDSGMNAGEDFDYYLRLWRSFRCVKVPRAFFVARQGRHSQGPRSATAEEWGTAVRSRLTHERAQRGLNAESPECLAIKNAAVQELQSFYRERALADATSYLALAREMPFRGSHRIEIDRARPFEMYSNNDDKVCLSLAWTGEYQLASSRLWQALARKARTILDIGAGTGYYSLLAAACSENAEHRIFCFEPRADNYDRLCLNISLNNVTNITPRCIAVGRDRGTTDIGICAAEGLLTTRSSGDDAERTESVAMISIDDFMHERRGHLDLVRIESAGSHLLILAGMQSVIAAYHPDILIDIHCNVPLTEIEQLLNVVGYQLFAIDEDAGTLRRRIPPAECAIQRCTLWGTVRDDAEVRAMVELCDIDLAID